MNDPGGSRPAASAMPTGSHRPGTLRRRLLATSLGGLAAGLAVCGLGVHLLLASTMVDRHQERVNAVATALVLAVVSADRDQRRSLLEASIPQEESSAGFRLRGLSLASGETILFEHPPGEHDARKLTAATEATGLDAVLQTAAFQAPVSTVNHPVDIPGVAKSTLTLRAESPGLVTELTRLDAMLIAGLLAVFSITAPFVVGVVIRLTAPLSSLRDAVRLARQAGRTDSYSPPPARRGHCELVALCGAIDALGFDVASARARLSTANHELTLQVKARTAELSQVNRQLEVEAEDKDHFLRAVTHDLNAPLRNIDGLSRMLLSKHAGELSEGAASRLERIGINVRQQHELINDLLELSRLRTKAHRPVEVRLGELVDEVANGLGYDLENANIGFEMRGEWPVIFAERNRLRQVFQNLIDNAIKYMMDSERRQITVTASRERDFADDVFEGVDTYRFAVMDTGRGIAAEDVSSVFRVFSRSTHSGTHDVAGRGVGLACVEAIVRRYGGRVGVESTLGAGSTFWFTLPVARVAHDRDGLEELPEGETQAGPAASTPAPPGTGAARPRHAA